MSLPTVSVIIPVRDGGQYVSELTGRLQDILEPGVDVILVDDHSTDFTRPALDEFAHARSDVLVIGNDLNPGVASARNYALRHATGEFIWFADADDAWEPGILRQLRETAARTDADMIVCRADLRTRAAERGPIVDGIDGASVMARADAWTAVMEARLHGYLWNKLIRRAALGEDPFALLSSQSDFTGVIRAISNSTRIAFIADVLYHHLIRPGSITRSTRHRTDNLATCVELFRTVAGADVPGLENRPMFAYFRVWFELLPLAETPARVGAPWAVIARLGREAQARLRGDVVASARRYSPSVYRRATAVRMFGPTYSLARGALIRLRNMRKGGR